MFNKKQAEEAIHARKNGIWDNPQLKKIGSLNVDETIDIQRINDLTEEEENWAIQELMASEHFNCNCTN